MRIGKYILIFILSLAMAYPVYAYNKDRGGKDPKKRTTVLKKGNFKKDDSFNSRGAKGFGPPDPGGGGGGNPVPIDPAYGLLLLAGASFSFYLLRKKKK